MSSRNNLVLEVYKDPRTVFTLPDLAILSGEDRFESINQKAHYYVETGKLLNPRRGIYAKEGFSMVELACKLYTPSYISLEYVLQRAGVIFQYGDTITMMGRVSREVRQGNSVISYHYLQGPVLFNPAGLLRQDNILIASPERAFLDTLYLKPHFYFDNTNSLSLETLNALLPIYQSRALEKRARHYMEGRT
jgi:hypothetical protein